VPLDAPQSLTNDEVYTVTAYQLSIDEVIAEDAVLYAKPLIKLPNQDGIVR
jgi:hypothetical protein